jgi:hypothetical protein
MSSFLANPWGLSIEDPSPDAMVEVLSAIDPDDEEHGAAWLADGDGRCLEMNGNGVLVWDVPDQPPRHMVGLDARAALQLWLKLAQGFVAEIDAEPWQPGSRPRLTSEQQAERELERHRVELEHDRACYDLLGAERADTACRRPGCSRGAVHQSVLCRPHHFESIQGKPCPFAD